MKLPRRLPARLSISILAVIAYLLTILVVAKTRVAGDVSASFFTALDVLLTLLGTAIVGDTWRPSGQSVPAAGAVTVLSSLNEVEPEPAP